jgi:hypothetical protein
MGPYSSAALLLQRRSLASARFVTGAVLEALDIVSQLLRSEIILNIMRQRILAPISTVP